MDTTKLDLDQIAARMQPPVMLGTRAERGSAVILPPDWTHISAAEPRPTMLEFNTLSALVSYCTLVAPGDGLPAGTLIATVDAHDKVFISGPLGGESEGFRRHHYVMATPILPTLPMGKWTDMEQMVLALATVFQKDANRDGLMRLFSEVTENDVRTTADDGLAQMVTVRRGIAVTAERVPNPVALAPFRTFSEIEQPASLMYLRMRKGVDGPQAMLTEADGGAWRRMASAGLGDWLVKALDGTGVKVLA